MSSHFNFKSLAFYAVAIGSVVVLFKIVSTYGETLKAQPPIEGRYRLASQTLPKCLQSSDLVLNIQQSGIYLNGSLLAIDKNPDRQKESPSKSNFEEKLSLNGRWNDRNLLLSGSIDKLATCGNQRNVTITGVVKGDNISGQIILDSAPKPVKFTAQKEVNQPQETKEHH